MKAFYLAVFFPTIPARPQVVWEISDSHIRTRNASNGRVIMRAQKHDGDISGYLRAARHIGGGR